MGARAVLALVRAGFRRHTSYRAAILGGAATNSMFGLLRAGIVTATLASAGGHLGGYAAAGGIAYVWISQALVAPLQIFTWDDLAVRVRSGDLAVDLLRPVDLQLLYGAQDLGRALALTLPRGLPPLAVGALTFGLALPTDPRAYLFGLTAVVLGAGVSFACRYLVNLSAVWLLDVRGVLTLYVTVTGVLCGLVVPVRWFPPWLATVDAATPFPAMLQAPADILTGRVHGTAVAGVLAVQVAWLAAMLAAGQLVQRAAARRLVVQGG